MTLMHPSVHLCQYWGGLPKDSLNSYETKCKSCVTYTTRCIVAIQDFWSWTFIYLSNSWTNQNSALPLACSALNNIVLHIFVTCYQVQRLGFHEDVNRNVQSWPVGASKNGLLRISSLKKSVIYSFIK